MTGRHVVSVETLMLRATTDSEWAYRHATAVPGPGETPDQAARRVSGIPADAPSTVVHSTSWRCRPEGEIVLTYAVCPDPEPWLPAIELPVLEIAAGDAPAAPAPGRVEVANVVAHAIRHLAFLTAEDPVVRRALAHHPEIVTALDQPRRYVTAF
ncbi:hypothetical protein [Nonomuraea aurantiaca]|uniref:hypothetical protein n=1 Tax=Nonomuraea aurantiaca TaxID=2878562 RepID=UPI001CD99488|nr:hypothetical protein [Nonomuraea aurantiaca]MCA2225040.1 hypothetical protein [Nonomuraea aurantiaca]